MSILNSLKDAVLNGKDSNTEEVNIFEIPTGLTSLDIYSSYIKLRLKKDNEVFNFNSKDTVKINLCLEKLRAKCITINVFRPGHTILNFDLEDKSTHTFAIHNKNCKALQILDKSDSNNSFFIDGTRDSHLVYAESLNGSIKISTGSYNMHIDGDIKAKHVNLLLCERCTFIDRNITITGDSITFDGNVNISKDSEACGIKANILLIPKDTLEVADHVERKEKGYPYSDKFKEYLSVLCVSKSQPYDHCIDRHINFRCIDLDDAGNKKVSTLLNNAKAFGLDPITVEYTKILKDLESNHDNVLADYTLDTNKYIGEIEFTKPIISNLRLNNEATNIQSKNIIGLFNLMEKMHFPELSIEDIKTAYTTGIVDIAYQVYSSEFIIKNSDLVLNSMTLGRTEHKALILEKVDGNTRKIIKGYYIPKGFIAVFSSDNLPVNCDCSVLETILKYKSNIGCILRESLYIKGVDKDRECILGVENYLNINPYIMDNINNLMIEVSSDGYHLFKCTSTLKDAYTRIIESTNVTLQDYLKLTNGFDKFLANYRNEIPKKYHLPMAKGKKSDFYKLAVKYKDNLLKLYDNCKKEIDFIESNYLMLSELNTKDDIRWFDHKVYKASKYSSDELIFGIEKFLNGELIDSISNYSFCLHGFKNFKSLKDKNCAMINGKKYRILFNYDNEKFYQSHADRDLNSYTEIRELYNNPLVLTALLVVIAKHLDDDKKLIKKNSIDVSSMTPTNDELKIYRFVPITNDYDDSQGGIVEPMHEYSFILGINIYSGKVIIFDMNRKESGKIMKASYYTGLTPLCYFNKSLLFINVLGVLSSFVSVLNSEISLEEKVFNVWNSGVNNVSIDDVLDSMIRFAPGPCREGDIGIKG